jgi:uncharacterized protein YkwD
MRKKAKKSFPRHDDRQDRRKRNVIGSHPEQTVSSSAFVSYKCSPGLDEIHDTDSMHCPPSVMHSLNMSDIPDSITLEEADHFLSLDMRLMDLTCDTVAASTSKSRPAFPSYSPFAKAGNTKYFTSSSSSVPPVAATQISESSTTGAKEQHRHQHPLNATREPWTSSVNLHASDSPSKRLASLSAEVEKLTAKLMVSESEKVALRVEFNRQQRIYESERQSNERYQLEQEQKISTRIAMDAHLHALRCEIEVERNALENLKTEVKDGRTKIEEREIVDAAVRGRALGTRSLSYLNILHYRFSRNVS